MTTHIIHTANGRLANDPGASALKALVAQALASGKPIVLHTHGGLVNKDKGREIADFLAPKFEVDTFPIFYVWESGFFDTILNNLGDIATETVFDYLLKKVSGIVDRKFRQDKDTRGLSLPKALLAPALSGEASVRAVSPPADTDQLTPLTADEQLDLVAELEADGTLQDLLATIEASKDNSKVSEDVSTRSAFSTVRASTQTLMSPDALARLTNGPDSRGLSSLKFVKAIISVAARVIKRFIGKRDHGLHATIVEEILREFYLTNVGGLIWTQMKKDTADGFGSDPLTCGGTAFLHALKEQIGDKPYPRIILTGHSTGAVFISHFLKAADVLLPPEVKFDVIFLAPAVTFRLFEEVVVHRAHRINDIRIFAMQDAVERGDILLKKVPFAYPSSLLYFVSGVTEQTVDEPLVGMQRYYDATHYEAGEFPQVEAVRQYLARKSGRHSWSIDDTSLQGLRSSAISHGDFDRDGPTLASVQHILVNGF